MIRNQPCSSCPYRQDAPSGLWSAETYDKLIPYDEPTWGQPMAPFACHATPEHECHGWAVCHSNRGGEHELLALRLADFGEVPEAAVPLFSSGTEAAKHGKHDIENPSEEAKDAVAKLMNKYERLR
jgi:hypothetical protein